MNLEITWEHVLFFVVAVVADWYIRRKLDGHFGASRAS